MLPLQQAGGPDERPSDRSSVLLAARAGSSAVLVLAVVPAQDWPEHGPAHVSAGEAASPTPDGGCDNMPSAGGCVHGDEARAGVEQCGARVAEDKQKASSDTVCRDEGETEGDGNAFAGEAAGWIAGDGRLVMLMLGAAAFLLVGSQQNMRTLGSSMSNLASS
jgi:hypothetical protein